MEWIERKDKEPKPGEHILAELYGCKIATFVEMTVREGEGLCHIVRWKPVGDKAEDCEI